MDFDEDLQRPVWFDAAPKPATDGSFPRDSSWHVSRESTDMTTETVRLNEWAKWALRRDVGMFKADEP